MCWWSVGLAGTCNLCMCVCFLFISMRKECFFKCFYHSINLSKICGIVRNVGLFPPACFVDSQTFVVGIRNGVLNFLL
jgi:hypothetical protein